jgi:hypothetical protein
VHQALPAALAALKEVTADSRAMAQCVQCVPPCTATKGCEYTVQADVVQCLCRACYLLLHCCRCALKKTFLCCIQTLVLEFNMTGGIAAGAVQQAYQDVRTWQYTTYGGLMGPSADSSAVDPSMKVPSAKMTSSPYPAVTPGWAQ